MEAIWCEVKNTDHNIFTYITTTEINIFNTKVYKTNMHFPEILIALAVKTLEILHSLENNSFFLMVYRSILTALSVASGFQTKFAVEYLGLELPAWSWCTESESPSHLENG